MVKPLFTKESFTTEVERIARKDQLSYATAMAELCDIHDIDVRDIKNLLAEPMLKKLENEARERNVIQKEKVLPHAFSGCLTFDE